MKYHLDNLQAWEWNLLQWKIPFLFLKRSITPFIVEADHDIYCGIVDASNSIIYNDRE